MAVKQSDFEAVDQYIETLFAPETDAHRLALSLAEENGWPPIHVSAGQGKFLYLMAKLSGARRILEIGTLAGYSTLWLAAALPDDGHLTTLELIHVQADAARTAFDASPFSDRIDIRRGPAKASLTAMEEEGYDPFDLVFLDANKDQYPYYLEAVTPMLRSGGLLLGDNVVRNGAVLAPEDSSAVGAAAFNKQLAAHPDYEAVILQQIGLKGWDGLAVARKR